MPRAWRVDHPNPGTVRELSRSGQRINQAVEHRRDGHLGAIAGTELVHRIAHVGLHRFHGHAEQIPDGVVSPNWGGRLLSREAS